MLMNKIIIATILISQSAIALTINKGITYDIVEPNVLQEIKQKSQQVNWKELQSRYELINTINKLPVATTDRLFLFTPITHLPFEVKDKNGKVIYPKGFKFNPLKYTTLPYKLVFVGSVKQFNFIKNKISKSDVIMVANMDTRDFINATKRRAFIATKDAITRVGVKKVPSIVEQKGDKFLIKEYRVEQL